MEEDDYNAEAAYGDEYPAEFEEQAAEGDDDMGMGIPGQQAQESAGPISHQGSGRIEQEDRSQAMQRKMMESLKEASKWRSAFKEVAALVGFSAGTSRDPDIQTVVETVQRMKTQGQNMQDEIRELHRREAALQIALADRNFEAAELRREVANGWTVSEPNLLQLRQLLLDPAVNREYVRMRAELEEAQREVKKLQEELVVAQFTPDSKIGRQLVAKCKSLAEENDQLGNELAEGKVQQLEASLALSRSLADELRMQVADLVEHCTALNEEVEALQRETFALRRKVKEYETNDAPADFQGRVMMAGGGGPQDAHFNMGAGGGGGRGGYRFRGRGGYRGRGGPHPGGGGGMGMRGGHGGQQGHGGMMGGGGGGGPQGGGGPGGGGGGGQSLMMNS